MCALRFPRSFILGLAVVLSACQETEYTTPNSTVSADKEAAAAQAADDASELMAMLPAIIAATASARLYTGRLVLSNPLHPAEPIALTGINYTVSSTQGSTQQGISTTQGQFSYGVDAQIRFTLFGQTIGPMLANSLLAENDLASSLCAAEADYAACVYRTSRNLRRLLLSVDSDANLSNGISIAAAFQQGVAPLALTASSDQFETRLAALLAAQGQQPAPLFYPSLGINTEAPQPEADEVGGQSLPFVDLFRVARPFREYSCTDISYDVQGWPITIPSTCDTQTHSVLKVPSWATTFMLRYVPLGAIPTGDYTVLYEGVGELQYSGIASKKVAASSLGRDIIQITPELIQTRSAAGLRLQIKNIDPQQPVRNIRIIMPGGTCAGNPLVRVENAEGCPVGAYRSFADRLAENRNAIIFNPDYLRFLKDFKVIRLMNLMEASPRNPCYAYTDEAYTTCLLQDFTWEQRAKMDDASWGGSARTPLIQRYARGVPLEVAVELVNQLGRDPWFTLPHNATNDYISQYAHYVRDHLRADLKVHLEYSNEPWNGIFWSALYVREKGKELDSNAYRAGYKYYSNRAVEIFNQWESIFGGTERLVRILNTYNPDEWMTRNMLSYNGHYQSVDVVASAPYFYGCWDRSNSACSDETTVPLLVKNAAVVDDLFMIMDNVNDPYGVGATLSWVKKQVAATQAFNVDLYSYEGGQHLTVDWTDTTLTTEQKTDLLNVIRAANRDPRMGERYTQLLNGWEAAGGKLFTLYTMPQTYHKFGTFGLKEYLNQPRSEAPKYNSVMQYQEQKRPCLTAETCVAVP